MNPLDKFKEGRDEMAEKKTEDIFPNTVFAAFKTRLISPLSVPS